MEVLGALYGSLIQAFLSTFYSALGGLILAWLITHTPNHPVKSLFKESLLLFFFLPSITLVLGLLKASQFMGWGDLFGLKGIILCHTFWNAPFMARALLKAYDEIPSALWREARHLSMGPLLCFRVLEGPFLRAPFLRSCGLIFCLCMASFSIPLMLTKSFHITSLSFALYNELVLEANTKEALFYAAPLFLLIIGKAALDKRAPATAPNPDLSAFSPSQNHWGRVCFLVVIALALFAPFIIGISSLLSGTFLTLLREGETLKALGNSTILALGAGLISTALSMTVATITCQKSPAVVTGVLSLFLLPSFVIAFVLSAFLGSAIDGASFQITLLLHILLPLPFGVRFLQSRLRRLKNQGERLRQTLRLSRAQAFRFLYFPQLRPTIGSVFSFSSALSLGDVGATALFGSDIETLPTLIFQALYVFDLEKALTLSVLLLGGVGFFCLPSLVGRSFSRPCTS